MGPSLLRKWVSSGFQLLAPLAGVVGADDTLVEKVENLGGSLFVQFFKLLQSRL